MFLDLKNLKEVVKMTDDEWREKTINRGIIEKSKDEYLIEEFVEYNLVNRRPPKILVNWLVEKLSRMLVTKDPKEAFAFIKRRGRPAVKGKSGRPITRWQIYPLIDQAKRNGIKKPEARQRAAAHQLGISLRELQRILDPKPKKG